MKYLLPLLIASGALFANTEEPTLEEVVLTAQPTFTAPDLPTPPTTATAPVLQKPYRSSFATVGLSMLMPGLGHVYLKDYSTAAGLFGSSLLLADTSPITAANLWFYNVFAAYRDVRINNNQKGYSYRMPMDDFGDLATAPFRWSVLKQPAVCGGILGSLALAAAVISVDHSVKCHVSPKASETYVSVAPLTAFAIGLGEESFFRGYLQSYFCERMEASSAIILSSVIFGAVHIPNSFAMPKSERWRYYSFSLPLITGLGGYMGWLTHKTKSLKGSVAIHAWYDFTLMLMDSLAAPTAIAGGKPQFAYSFNF